MAAKYRCRFCYKSQGHNRATCPVSRELRADMKLVATRVEKLRTLGRGDVRDWPETRALLRLLSAV